MKELERRARESVHSPEPKAEGEEEEKKPKAEEEEEEKQPTTTGTPAWLGLLKCKRPHKESGFKAGTGTLIGPRIVCTAAHVVYDAAAKQAITQGWFLRGFTGSTELERLPIEKVYIPPDYIKAVDSGSLCDRYDVAFVKLAAPAPDVARRPMFAAVKPSLAHQSLVVYGYPGATTLLRQTTPVRTGVLEEVLKEVDGPGCPLLLVSTHFDSGGSGGPVLLANEEDLIGVVTDLVASGPNQLLLFTTYAQKQYEEALAAFT